ncbi:LPS assembly lipoprotein LptE [Roseomonas sp. E05]|uniref:LPS assembly lipoprotein LptE n=1 Tax=Roseomonas sp. E05 TaxID=3046310 RepID=UPI0024B9B50C|nr:LPS assembly lipoprotein LptE [Roseomonas sp. E05]MDJ0387729.1 LPS assembly lipoprotein LptE [Roseomonas sp. E05]
MSERRPVSAARRRLLALGAAGLTLAGCGFRPLYAPRDSAATASDPAIRSVLASTEVALIPERSGQLLRRALQQRLGRFGAAAPTQELRVSLQFGAEPEGFRRDGTATRTRYTATASWLLVSRSTPPAQVAQGVERAFDAFDIPDNQFFAADFARDATIQRLIEQLADDIVLRLSVQLRAQQKA